MHDRAGPSGVDPEIVPVDEEDEVIKPEPPGRVLRFMARARGEGSLTLDRDNVDPVRVRSLQGDRLTNRGGNPMAGRARVPLQEEGLALHLGMPGYPPRRRRSARSSHARESPSVGPGA